MFNKIFKIILVIGLLFSLTHFSKAQDKLDAIAMFAQAEEDFPAMAVWVMNNSYKGTKLTFNQAMDIVRAAHVAGINKGIDPVLLLAFAKKESTFRINVRSGYGAVGLMQVVPRFHKEKIRGRNIVNPYVNFDVGSDIFKECLQKNKGSVRLAMSCYSGYTPKQVSQYMVFVTNTKREIQKHIDIET